MQNFIANEPVVVGVLTMIGALFGMLIVFGVHITPEQKQAVLTFAGASLWVAHLVRTRVTPNHKVGLAHG